MVESLTNSCFEFWLLLHFDKVFELEQNKLLENPKVTAKKKVRGTGIAQDFTRIRKRFI